MSRRITWWALAVWMLSVSSVLAEGAPQRPSGGLGASTWWLSYNWQAGAGTTAITFYEDGTFKTSEGRSGRWVQGESDDARAFFAFSEGSLPDWSVVYSSTVSGDGLSFSGIQGCSHLAGQARGTHTAVKANFAEDPTRLQSVVALTSQVAADSTALVAKTAAKTVAKSAKKPSTRSTKKTASKSASKSPSKAAAKTASKTASKATASAASKKTSKSSRTSASQDAAQKSSGSRAASTKVAGKDLAKKVSTPSSAQSATVSAVP